MPFSLSVKPIPSAILVVILIAAVVAVLLPSTRGVHRIDSLSTFERGNTAWVFVTTDEPVPKGEDADDGRNLIAIKLHDNRVEQFSLVNRSGRAPILPTEDGFWFYEGGREVYYRIDGDDLVLDDQPVHSPLGAGNNVPDAVARDGWHHWKPAASEVGRLDQDRVFVLLRGKLRLEVQVRGRSIHVRPALLSRQ